MPFARDNHQENVMELQNYLRTISRLSLIHILLDGIVGLGIAVFIIISGVKLVSETLSPLLGEAPNKELVTDILEKLRGYDGCLLYTSVPNRGGLFFQIAGSSSRTCAASGWERLCSTTFKS